MKEGTVPVPPNCPALCDSSVVSSWELSPVGEPEQRG
jgi:hypothetical protein